MQFTFAYPKDIVGKNIDFIENLEIAGDGWVMFFT